MKMVIEVFFITSIIFGLLILSFYLIMNKMVREYSSDNYTILLRNGRVRKTFKGGKILVRPLIDEVIIIPIKVIETQVKINEYFYIQGEKKRIDLQAVLKWRVTDPELAYTKVSWEEGKEDNAYNIIRNLATTTIIKLFTTIDTYENPGEMTTKVFMDLQELIAGWGIFLEVFTIIDFKISDK